MLRKDVVALGVRFLAERHAVQRIPVDGQRLFRQQLEKFRRLGAGADVLRRFIFDKQAHSFLFGDLGHFADVVGHALEHGFRLRDASERERAHHGNIERMAAADRLAQLLHSPVELGLFPRDALLARFGLLRGAARRLGSWQSEFQEGSVEKRNADASLFKFRTRRGELVRLQRVIGFLRSRHVAKGEPLHAELLGELNRLGGRFGDFIGDGADAGAVDFRWFRGPAAQRQTGGKTGP